MNRTAARNFALIGVGGYIAPRHLKAIRDTGHRVIAALDKSDSVGILDSYFHDSAFFTEFERFDRHAEKLRRLGEEHRIHYVGICSPNYLHDAHIRFALRIGADAICEKPLVLNPWNLDALRELERESGRKIYNILQLRLHPAVVALRNEVLKSPPEKTFDIDLTYITSRGRWYHVSWKGDETKSGGIATNIGIHFFDMLLWIFGPLKEHKLHHADRSRMSGFLQLEKARVRWFLSVDQVDLPASVRGKKQSTFRALHVGSREIEFSDGFTDLHTESYKAILSGEGFGIEDCRPSVSLVSDIRKATPVMDCSCSHPFLHPVR